MASTPTSPNDWPGPTAARVTGPLGLIDAVPALAHRIDPELPYVWAEVIQAVRSEHARSLADVLTRRVPLYRDARDQGLGVAARTAAILAEELGWDDQRREQDLADYEAAVARSRRWREELAGGTQQVAEKLRFSATC